MSIFSRLRETLSEAIESVERLFKREDKEEQQEEQEQKTEERQIERDDTEDAGEGEEDSSTDGLLWDFNVSGWDIHEYDESGKTYIEEHYTVYLNDGTTIEGDIRFYGDYDDLEHAIIAKEADIDSEDIAAIGIG